MKEQLKVTKEQAIAFSKAIEPAFELTQRNKKTFKIVANLLETERYNEITMLNDLNIKGDSLYKLWNQNFIGFSNI